MPTLLDLDSRLFSFKNLEQTFTVPVTGWYFLECIGGGGGKSLGQGQTSTTVPGNGGYSYGIVYLKKGAVLYIHTGGKGADGVVGKDSDGGYNGGGIGSYDRADDEVCGGGGGATHIALAPGLLSSLSSQKDQILMVAGGGGGSSVGGDGGNGGGLNAENGKPNGDADYGKGGTVVAGFAFGKGQDATDYKVQNQEVAGGGGGFYGGTSGVPTTAKPYLGGAGGGSGYLSPLIIEGCGKTKGTGAHTTASDGYVSVQLMMPDINKFYLSPNGVAEKPKSDVILGDGTAHHIDRLYIGDNNNKPKLIWASYK